MSYKYSFLLFISFNYFLPSAYNKQSIMKALKIILKGIAFLVIFLIAFLVFATITDFKPVASEVIYESESPDLIDVNTNLSLMIWNIGYCGLSDDMDFFYDGGKQVRASGENVKNNISQNVKFISKNDSLSFVLLQEVDLYSRRSYFTNQFDTLNNRLSKHKGFFAKNYDVKFVPTPPLNPLGRVKSGIAGYSVYNPSTVTRYSFPGNFSWPTNLFMLDRCFLVMRFPTTNNKELLVINTHNSAYDDGSLKIQQMEYLKKFLTDEYNKGNYIIVGGDWNQNPPQMAREDLKENSPAKRFILNSVPDNYLPERWSWVYDPGTPTNRYLNMPYNEKESIKITIDFFLISPNIESIYVKAADLNFKHSDHQPVFCVVKLK